MLLVSEALATVATSFSSEVIDEEELGDSGGLEENKEEEREDEGEMTSFLPEVIDGGESGYSRVLEGGEEDEREEEEEEGVGKSVTGTSSS